MHLESVQTGRLEIARVLYGPFKYVKNLVQIEHETRLSQ